MGDVQPAWEVEGPVEQCCMVARCGRVQHKAFGWTGRKNKTAQQEGVVAGVEKCFAGEYVRRFLVLVGLSAVV